MRIPVLNTLLDCFWRLAPTQSHDLDDRALERAQAVVRITYIVWFGYCLVGLRTAATLLPPGEGLLWNVAWVQYLPWYPALYTVLGVAAAGALLAAAFPNTRIFRLLTFLAVFTYQGLRFSYGKIDHSSHTWILSLFLLVFLTRLPFTPTMRQKRAYFEIIWGAQVATFACYSLAGFQKLWGAWLDIGYTGITIFHPDALAIQISRLNLIGEGDALLSWMVIAYSGFGYPLMLIAIYLECTALIAAFRPRLHLIWAMLLMAFHAGNSLIMNIWFDPMVLMVGVYFFLSPFTPATFSLTATVHDLPIIGVLLATLQRLTKRLKAPKAAIE